MTGADASQTGYNRRRKPPLRTLRELRLARGWTLPELAERAQINRAVLSQVERGRMVATPAELAALSDALALETPLENRMQAIHEDAA